MWARMNRQSLLEWFRGRGHNDDPRNHGLLRIRKPSPTVSYGVIKPSSPYSRLQVLPSDCYLLVPRSFARYI
jgi:hypothetical protein